MGWLSNARTHAGYATIAEFRAALQVHGLDKSAQALAHWELEDNIPPTTLGSPDQLNVLARVLDMPVTTILRNAGFVGDLDLASSYNSNILHIANRLDKFPDDKQAEILAVINQLLDLFPNYDLSHELVLRP